MYVALPARGIAVNGQEATVEPHGGMQATADIVPRPDVAVGQYVIVDRGLGLMSLRPPSWNRSGAGRCTTPCWRRRAPTTRCGCTRRRSRGSREPFRRLAVPTLRRVGLADSGRRRRRRA